MGETQPASGLIAEIVTTGTEILLGDIVDTNAAWIAQQLRDAGVNLYFKTTVGDNEERLRGVLEQGIGRSDVIIVTGGLGPTVDDITRQAIANATHRPLRLNEEALATLEERFRRFGSKMTENNRQQALIPEGATMIHNPVGTAPGFIAEMGRCSIVALPGVPREMKHLMTETVLPWLRAKAGGAVIRRRILRTMGIGESTIDSLLEDLMRGSNPTMGLAAHTGQADVRIAARAESEEAAEALLDEIEREVRRRIGDYIYSTTPGETFEAVVTRRLKENGLRVALLESNTGGALAQRMAAADKEGAPVALALLTTDATLPADVAHALAQASLPAQEVVRAAAAALRKASEADIAIAILGTTGEGEGVYGTKAGETWLAEADQRSTQVARLPFGGTDAFTTVRIGNSALRLIDDGLAELTGARSKV